PAIGEVGPEQRFHDSILHTLLPGQPDEPVSVEGVRSSLNPVESNMDVFDLANSNYPGIEFLRALPASELFRAILPAADAFFRHRRVELEGKPAHTHRPAKSGDGLLQPPLADVAPRADHVGDHVNDQAHGVSVNSCRNQSSSA